MKRISQVFLFGAPIVILLAAACAPVEQAASTLAAQANLTSSPTAFGTDTTGTAETATVETSEATATNTTLTPSIPVTGLDVIRLDCQYCVDNIAHAQLVIPKKATFKVTSPEELASSRNNGDNDDENDNGEGDDDNSRGRLGCRTIDRFRDTKLVLCRAEENTTITLNVCLDDTCTEVQLTLQPCTLTATPSPIATTTTTTTVTATLTPTPGTATVTFTPVASETATPTPTVVTNTPLASATNTNTPTPTPTLTSTPTP